MATQRQTSENNFAELIELIESIHQQMPIRYRLVLTLGIVFEFDDVIDCLKKDCDELKTKVDKLSFFVWFPTVLENRTSKRKKAFCERFGVGVDLSPDDFENRNRVRKVRKIQKPANDSALNLIVADLRVITLSEPSFIETVQEPELELNECDATILEEQNTLMFTDILKELDKRKEERRLQHLEQQQPQNLPEELMEIDENDQQSLHVLDVFIQGPSTDSEPNQKNKQDQQPFVDPINSANRLNVPRSRDDIDLTPLLNSLPTSQPQKKTKERQRAIVNDYRAYGQKKRRRLIVLAPTYRQYVPTTTNVKFSTPERFLYFKNRRYSERYIISLGAPDETHHDETIDFEVINAEDANFGMHNTPTICNFALDQSPAFDLNFQPNLVESFRIEESAGNIEPEPNEQHRNSNPKINAERIKLNLNHLKEAKYFYMNELEPVLDSNHGSIGFGALTVMKNRVQKAIVFYHLLHLKANRVIELEQERCYSDLTIRLKI